MHTTLLLLCNFRSRVPLDPRKSANYIQAEHLAFILSYDLFKSIEKEDGPQRILPGTEVSEKLAVCRLV